jgi:hypothetical protein
MVMRFPIRPKEPQQREAALGDMGLNIIPFFPCVKSKSIPSAKQRIDGIKTSPVILKFPVRTL